ncbi:hypothetical protein B0H14DRAFT_2567460 [Mycena olivaceomarginata]|nr:hypothetical protein B0H14DRAFT_2567460 [Mycena olivaceomarginata]
MYLQKLSLFTVLAVLSVVNGQKEEWLCNCTTKGQNNATTTRQCCAQAPGAFVPGPPARRKTSSTAVSNLKEASVVSRSMGLQSDGKRRVRYGYRTVLSRPVNGRHRFQYSCIGLDQSQCSPVLRGSPVPYYSAANVVTHPGMAPSDFGVKKICGNTRGVHDPAS